MARCKECLHYEVCAKEGRLVQVDEHTWDEYNKLDDVEQFCTNYFTADVVPKSEVEVLQELNNEAHKSLRKLYDNDTKALCDSITRLMSELEISQHLLKEAWKRIEELDKLCGELQRKYDMTERKFADEEIIKALEWCIQNSECEYCEYREKTDKSDICPIRMDALNLINKQNAEVETLKDNNEHLAVMLEEAKSEVERLQAEKDALVKNYAECMKDYAREIFADIEKAYA